MITTITTLILLVVVFSAAARNAELEHGEDARVVSSLLTVSGVLSLALYILIPYYLINY